MNSINREMSRADSAQAATPEHHVRLHANENPLGASSLAQKLCQSLPALLSEYPDGSYKALREAIGERWNVEPEQLVVGSGTDELIDIAMRSLLKPGSRMVALEHSFIMYKLRADLLGVNYYEIFCDPQGDYATALQRAMENKPDVLVLVNPSNPLGGYMTPQTLLALVAEVPQSTTLIIDEVYAEFTPDRESSAGMQLVKQRQNSICLRSFSKSYGIAGLRLGWAYTSTDLVPLLQARRAPYNVSAFSALAGEYVLEDSTHLDRTTAHCLAWGEELVSLFAEHGISARSQYVNFVFVDFADRQRCENMHRHLHDAGFLTSHLANYGLESCLRISFGNQEQMTRLDQVLRNKLAEQEPCPAGEAL
ncbi:pyridoxal phosphate-dependent aminotransferase [Pseudomonas sp. MSSRFD41]|uniref:pyridoxal phosphate-dependent aminotransferase n=1 Tax=Pseudomonas sp. MSSRFD41 TaxID=1310370 RepID=UPI0021AE1CC4|nr:histidinol-phosphate transaminase [Pseudomonas sp. MSSRFD41]